MVRKSKSAPRKWRLALFVTLWTDDEKMDMLNVFSKELELLMQA